MDHQPVEAILPNGHFLRELEQRPDVVFALEVEVRNGINTPPKVAIHRNIESLSAKRVGCRDVMRHEELADLLSNSSSELLHHREHCCIHYPGHALSPLHSIDL